MLANCLIARMALLAVTAAAARTTLFARARFIHGQRAAFPILAIQGFDRRLRAFGRVHRRERKATRASGFFVHDDVDLVHRSMLGQHVAQIVFGNIKRKIPDV